MTIVGYKSKRGKIARVGAPTLTLYHFTPPYNLPDILQGRHCTYG
jgi:hypothetical protein